MTALYVAIGIYAVAFLFLAGMGIMRARRRRRITELERAAGYAPRRPSPTQVARNNFNRHVLNCARCREHPLDLCDVGRALLTFAVDDHEGTIV